MNAAKTRQARVWFKPFARLGYASRGLVYAVIGAFALFAAFGTGESIGSRDALEMIISSNYGGAVAVALIAGMISYALWRLIQSFFDTDRHGTDFKGLAIRAGLIASAVTYGVLALYTYGLWSGNGGSGGGGGSNLATGIAGFIGSRAVAVILTLVFAGAGIAHIVKAMKKRYARYFQAPPRAMKAVHPIAQTGLIARGAVFIILAFLFFYRGLSAGEEGGGTPGVKAALEFLSGLPAGFLLIGAMGLGLICFSLYSFLEALWRRINVEDADAVR